MLLLDPQTIVLAVLIGSLLLFLRDVLRYDLVALLVVFVLSATQCLTPEEAFAGFSSPAVVLIGSMYVFGHAITRWGVAEWIGEKFLAGSDRSETSLVLRITLVTGLLSGVLSNTGVVAIFIPLVSSLARSKGLQASRVMMPLAFASLLGGLLTVLGTSKNLIVNSIISDYGAEPFGLFEFTWYGLLLVVIGSLFMVGPGRALLPRSRVDETLTDHYRVRRFVTEVLVEPSSTLVNRPIAQLPIFDKHAVALLGIVRDDEMILPGPYNNIRRDDTLILQGEPEAIVRLRDELGLQQREEARVGETRLSSTDVELVEAVVPADSSLVGNTLRRANFKEQTGLNVLALSKHGEVQLGKIARTKLEVGDTLLIQGHTRDVDRARKDRDVLVLGAVPRRRVGRGARLTTALLAAVLLVSAFKVMPLSLAALGGALLLVLTGAIPFREAYKGIDWSVLLLVGGMLALGKAFEKHGLATEIAGTISGLGDGSLDPRVMLAILLFAAIVLTQLTTHVAAAVLLTPVALEVAQQMGCSDRPFLLAVLTGASSAFMSPVAHPVNAMVAGPGDYKYVDFLRVGTPVTLLIAAVAVVILPLLWPFELVR